MGRVSRERGRKDLVENNRVPQGEASLEHSALPRRNAQLSTIQSAGRTERALQPAVDNIHRTPRRRKQCRSQSGHEAEHACGAIDSLVAEAENRVTAELQGAAIIAAPELFEATQDASLSCIPWGAEGIQLPTTIATLGLQIVLPVRGQLRARKLIGRSRRVMTGKYPSWKMGRMMHWESRLEAKVLRLLDACPAVERFAEQPFTILYLQDGRWRAHVPDVVVQTVRGDRWILEVKNDRDPRLEDALHRAEILKPRLGAFGIKYTVVHQHAIDAGSSLQNAGCLLRFGRGEPRANAHQAFIDLLAHTGELRRSDLVGTAIDNQHAISVGSQLALRGLLSLNWLEANTRELTFKASADDNSLESLQWLLHALGATKQL